MLRNYITIAWRHVKKHPAYSIQNIFGLSVALAVAILTIVYVKNEFSFDKHYQNSERIFRLNTDFKIGDQEVHTAQSSDVLGPILAERFTEVESYVRFFALNAPFRIRKDGKSLKETHAVFADSSLFTVFNIPMVEKLAISSFSEPNTIIISKSIADKYFSGQTAVGHTLALEDVSHSTQKNGSYKVVAVMEDFSKNAHFKFDFIFPITNLEYGWGNYAGSNFNTYILLRKDADYHVINQHLQNITQSQIYPVVSQQLGISQTWKSFIESGNKLTYSLFPMPDIHLYSNREGELSQNGSIETIYILTALALFVLLMASVNYVNLATSRAIGRMREVALRKVLGSNRGSLVFQFLSESLVLVTISAIAAFFIALSILPAFNAYLSASIPSADLFQFSVLLYILLITVFVGLLSGAYPAFFLSNFKIANTIKGAGNPFSSGSLLRRYLIVAQLTISVVLGIGTFTVYQQLEYIQKADIGYNKEQVLIINNVNSLGNRVQTFKNELSNTSGIISASLTGIIPVNSSKLLGNYSKEASRAAISATPMRTWWVDENFLETMAIPMLEGNNFSRISVKNDMQIIINEEAVKALGLDDPIGKRIYTEEDRHFIITGVVKNFNYESLREKVGPVLLMYSDGSNEQYAAIRFSTDHDFSTTFSRINKAWTNLHPEEPMDYYFLDEAFNRMYHNDQIISKIGLSIALLAGIITAIGLLGMISYATEKRKKEIGVRKVFGASIYDILKIFFKDVLMLVMISLLIASPIAFWSMNKWLQDFAYRIIISWWIFVMSGVLAMLIVLFTVSFQAIKAALANPVKSLRSE